MKQFYNLFTLTYVWFCLNGRNFVNDPINPKSFQAEILHTSCMEKAKLIFLTQQVGKQPSIPTFIGHSLSQIVKQY